MHMQYQGDLYVLRLSHHCLLCVPAPHSWALSKHELEAWEAVTESEAGGIKEAALASMQAVGDPQLWRSLLAS